MSGSQQAGPGCPGLPWALLCMHFGPSAWTIYSEIPIHTPASTPGGAGACLGNSGNPPLGLESADETAATQYPGACWRAAFRSNDLT